MKKRFIFSALLIFFFLQFAHAQLFPDPKNTYVVLFGVLEWQDSKSLGSFDKKNRKDAELNAFFTKQGIPSTNMIALYDANATRKKMLEAMTTISQKANKDATIVFYYAGHGVLEKKAYYLANYDMGMSDLPNLGFPVSSVSEIFGKSAANRILLFADCCYSGSLIFECQKLNKLGKKSIALTSATSSNLSTGNWTFTQTFLDCLNGNALADHNGNNTIELSELATELFQAMKHRERQMLGSSIEGLDASTKVASKKSSSSCDDKCGKYFWAKYEKQWQPVRITISGSDGAYTCEHYFYSDKVQVSLTKDKFRPIYFVKHNLGDAVQIEWKKQSYKAKIIEVKDDFYLIKYDDYDSSWNEWVLYDRIRTGKEKTIKALDAGDYYPAEVLEEKNGKFYIHYTGFGYEFDEWVDSSRIK